MFASSPLMVEREHFPFNAMDRYIENTNIINKRSLYQLYPGKKGIPIMFAENTLTMRRRLQLVVWL